jgi:hypothetical protein
MSWGLNDGRGSVAVLILIPGTEWSAVALEEKYAWDSGSEAAKTPWRLTSKAPCMHTVSQKALLLQRALRFLFYPAPSIHLTNVCIFAVVKNTMKILADWLHSSYFMSMCSLSTQGLKVQLLACWGPRNILKLELLEFENSANIGRPVRFCSRLYTHTDAVSSYRLV